METTHIDLSKKFLDKIRKYLDITFEDYNLITLQ